MPTATTLASRAEPPPETGLLRLPPAFPVIPLRDMVIFPHMVTQFFVGQSGAIDDFKACFAVAGDVLDRYPVFQAETRPQQGMAVHQRLERPPQRGYVQR